MATFYDGQTTQVGILDQTVWGTAAADSAAAEVVVCDYPDLDFDPKERTERRCSNGKRWRVDTDALIDFKGSMPKLPLSFNATKTGLAKIFYSFFQSATEVNSTPYKKVFTLAAAQPDFPNITPPTSGYFDTVIVKHPAASTSLKFIDSISSELALDCQPGSLLGITTTKIGRGSVTTNSNPSGTWTPPARTYYHYEDIARFTFDFGAGAQAMYLMGGWALNLSYEVTATGQDSGKFQTYSLTNPTGTFTARVNWDANARTWLTNAAAGTYITVNIGWGNATAGTVDGDLDLTFTVTPKIPKTNGDKDIVMDVEGTVVGHSSAAPITVILADGTDRNWTAPA